MVRRLRERSPGISLTRKELVSSAQLEALDAGQFGLSLLRPHAEYIRGGSCRPSSKVRSALKAADHRDG